MIKLFWAELIVMASWVGYFFLGLFAQTPGGENLGLVNTPTTAVGALVAGFTAMTGLMVWIVKRLLDTTLPGLQESFHQALLRQQEVFAHTQENYASQLRELQATFKAEIAAERDFFARQVHLFVEQQK